MADFLESFLPDLIAYRLPGLELGEDVVYPAYHGRSLLNLPATILHILGVPGFQDRTLEPMLLEAIGSARRVVLLVIDALGLDRFLSFMEQGLGAVWAPLRAEGIFAPLTSISPSTTAAALTTLWTGAGPAEHGVLAYELWLKEYGVVANMITHSVMSYNGDAGGLRRAGFRPESFLPVPTLGSHLSRHGILSWAFMHQAIARSGLSQMHFQGVDIFPYRSAVDLWITLREFLERNDGQPSYVYVYWGDLDELSHRFGPEDERVAAEFDNFSIAFEHGFYEPRRRRRSQGDTLLILTADHGQIATPFDPHNDLHQHARLLDMLHMRPTGENRLPFLYVRPGKMDAVRAYVQEQWPNGFTILTPREVLNAGLLGPGQANHHTSERLGDLILVPHGNTYWWWADKEDSLRGRHGGLSREEMLIPFLAAWV